MTTTDSEPAESPLSIDRSDGVVTITLDRPAQLNAFNDAQWDGLRDSLVALNTDDEARCVVITGAGRAFSAGQDLAEMAAPPHHEDGETHGYPGLMPALEGFCKPLIAAVNGIGIGIGMTILPHCDIVLMASSARLRTPFVPLGVTCEGASSLLFPQTMGWQNAAYVLFTGDWVTASEAVAMGLAFREVPDDRLADEAHALAARIASGGVNSLTATKRLMVEARRSQVEAARVRELEAFVGLIGTPENLAALDKFLG